MSTCNSAPDLEVTLNVLRLVFEDLPVDLGIIRHMRFVYNVAIQFYLRKAHSLLS